MKLIEILSAREAIKEVRRWTLPGATALRVRRETDKLLAEINRFESWRDERIRTLGEDTGGGKIEISEESEAHETFRREYRDAVVDDVDVDVRPALAADELPECSAETVDALVRVGLIQEEDDG